MHHKQKANAPFMPQSTPTSGRGARFREERERLGLSQAELAARLDVHRNTVARWEQSESGPPGKLLEKLREIAIDADYLVLGDHVPTDGQYGAAAASVLGPLCDRMGLCFEAVQLVIELKAKYLRSRSFSGADSADLTEQELGSLLDLLMDNSVLLADVLHALDDAQHALEVSVPLLKLPQVVTMLCRTFKPAGKVDEKVVQDVVSLAGL